MEDFDFGDGCRYGCIATIFKMIFALAFWGLVAAFIFNPIIYGTYGGFSNSPLGWKIAGIAIVLILIWRVASKPLDYFKYRGYEAGETIVLGSIGCILGGGLPVLGAVILIIYIILTE